MSQDYEFQDLRDNLENTAAYKLCVLVAMGVPVSLSAMSGVGALGMLASAGAGAAVGVRFCPRLVPAIRQKFTSARSTLTPDEFRSLVRETKRDQGVGTGRAIELIAQERAAVLRAGGVRIG